MTEETPAYIEVLANLQNIEQKMKQDHSYKEVISEVSYLISTKFKTFFPILAELQEYQKWANDIY